mgnify:CR=1 FL=1
MMESDLDLAPDAVRPPFYVRGGIEAWEDSARVPWNSVEILGDHRFSEGVDAAELETSALIWGQKAGAHGMVVLWRKKRTSETQVEVGRRQADLNMEEFDLKEHGVKQEETHFGTEINQKAVTWEIRVRFFKYRTPTPLKVLVD